LEKKATDEYLCNENRHVGIIEAFLKEFYLYAYTVRLLTNRKKLGLVDEKVDTLKAISMDKLALKVKGMNSARRKVNAQTKKILALEERIGFNGIIMGIIDSQNETSNMIDEKLKNEEGTDVKIDPRIKYTVEARIERLLKDLKELRKELTTTRNDVIKACSSDDALTVRLEAKNNADAPYYSMRQSLMKLRRSSSSHRDIHQAYEKKRTEAAAAAAEKKKSPSSQSQVVPFDEDELNVCCRTITWNLHYWYHKPVIGQDCPDISTYTDEEGMSICGWIRGEKEEGVTGRAPIQRAKRVSVTTPLLYPLTPGGSRKKRKMNIL
jgi:hypothetical protein